MAELPPPSDPPAPILGGVPLGNSLPPRPVESLHRSEIGNHTPGKNSDAFYIAQHHQVGRILALVGDGLTGGVRERVAFSGAWVAEKLVASLSTGFNLYQPLSRDRVLSLLSEKNSRGIPLYARYLVSAMSNDAVDRCVAQFLEEHRFATGKLPTDPPLIDRGAGEASLSRYRQRYVAFGKVLEAAIKFDAVFSTLANDRGEGFRSLTDSPAFRLALAIIDSLEPYRAEFNQKLRPYLVEYGGSTIVGAVELEDSFLLFNAGDSRACIVGPNGVHPGSLTPCHQTSEGSLASFAGIDGTTSNAELILPEQLSTIRIPKSELLPNSYLVMWSDGYYIDFVLERFKESVAKSPLSAADIVAAMESCHENLATAALSRNKKFSVDDRTGIIIKVS